MLFFKKTSGRFLKSASLNFVYTIILIVVLLAIFVIKKDFRTSQAATTTCPFPMVGNFARSGGITSNACVVPKGLTTVESGNIQLGNSEIPNRSYTIQTQASSTLVFNPSYFIKLLDATSSILIGGKPSEIIKGYFCASDTDNDGCYVTQASPSLPCPNSGKRYYDLTLLTSPYLLEDCNPNNNQQCGLLSEMCDGIDNNCNGLIDEGAGTFNLLTGYNAAAWHSAVLDASGTKMILYGGLDIQGAATGQVLIYNFVTGSWNSGRAGLARAGHTAVVKDNKMYVYGGDDGGNFVYNTLLVYDIMNDVWLAAGPSGPGPRTNHSAVFYNNKMYVYGGALRRAGSYVQDSLFIYDFNSNSWSSGPSYLPRAFHGAAVYQNKMYVFGGYENNAFPNYPNGTMLVFDFQANGGLGQWSVGIGSNRPSAMHTVAVNLDKFYVYSVDLSYPRGTIYTFDFITNQWTYGPVFFGSTDIGVATAGVFYNNKFYIYGGEPGAGTVSFSTFIEFIPCHL